jgi:hypothetical protein
MLEKGEKKTKIKCASNWGVNGSVWLGWKMKEIPAQTVDVYNIHEREREKKGHYGYGVV